MALTLFENITQELTDFEKDTLVPMLISTLEFTHDSNRHTGKNICGWFKSIGQMVSEPRLRKMINYIRVTNLLKPYVVIGASNGYYITNDIEVVKDQIESIEGRISSMAAVVDTMKAQLLNLKRTA